jgi:signal peptidase
MYQILTNQEQLPSIANYTPLIVLTESMEPTIQSGDLIICRNTAAENVNENDIISFYDPASNSSSIITHRVVQVIQKDGNIFFETKGDNNNVADTELVPAENLVGVYKTQIHDIGSLLMYMQTTQGLLTCVILPIGLILLYDKIRNNLQAKKLS